MKLLQNYVTRQAEQRPEAIAVVSKEHSLTYCQLEEQSNRLARLLQAAGCQRGDRVCFLMPKSTEAIICIQGILKADCIYVPLDSSSPAARVQKIIEACKPRFIIVAGMMVRLLDEILSNLPLHVPPRIGWLGEGAIRGQNFSCDFTRDDLRGFSAETPGYQNSETDVAHILFTSGSTGMPKGVMITHANVRHFIEWAVNYFGTQPANHISSHPPLHFDLSTFDQFGTFAAGAQLHLVPVELNLLPHQMAEFMRASELTQWFSVPSVLNYMARMDVVQFGDFPTLERLLWCGEVFPTPALQYWMQRLPHVRFTNLYGPTEATIASSYFTVTQCPMDEKALIPIGTACAGEELLILDDAMQAVPPGEIGNLYIRGVGLSPGYWCDQEKTDSVFRRLPAAPGATATDDRVYLTGDLARLDEHGQVIFLGRADSQIKSRGYRIELGEIEAALNALPQLRECAVVAISTDGFEGTAICCAYVLTDSAQTPDLTPAMLRTALAKALPAYMLPARWLRFVQLPKNANGKIDRRRLREQFEETETLSHARSGQAG